MPNCGRQPASTSGYVEIIHRAGINYNAARWSTSRAATNNRTVSSVMYYIPTVDYQRKVYQSKGGERIDNPLPRGCRFPGGVRAARRRCLCSLAGRC